MVPLPLDGLRHFGAMCDHGFCGGSETDCWDEYICKEDTLGGRECVFSIPCSRQTECENVD